MSKFSAKNLERKNYWNRNYFYKYSYDKLYKKGKVLDVGCGFGEFLKQGTKQIYGIDSSYKNLEEARKYSGSLIQGNVLELPFYSQFFDGINCSHVIEHLNPDGAYNLLCELDRVLKRGGTLIISSPVLWSGFYSDLTHVKPYHPEAIMHYYGKRKIQTTKSQIMGIYEIEEIKWRYVKQALNPLILPRGGILNTLSFLFMQFLNDIGFGTYLKTGYTMILKKVG